MKLAICHAPEDEAVARELLRVCEELSIDATLDSRNDWLLHAFHGFDEGTTHVLVVWSPANEASLWLPFRVGRATEHALPIALYRHGPPPRSVPPFLAGLSRLATTDELCEHLGALRDRV